MDRSGTLHAAIAIALTVVSPACGGEPQRSSPPTAAASVPAPTATLPPGAIRVTAGSGSKATVRVRELLAVNTIQTDAVLSTESVSGSAVMLADGSFTPDSKIVVEVRKLKSDEALRDKWVQLFGLEWDKWPTAEFVPTKAAGLPLPLPASGEWTFTLDGHLHIRDMTRDVTWQVKGTRSTDTLNATANAVVHWADFGVPKPQAAVTQVVSVTDDIRIELQLAGAVR